MPVCKLLLILKYKYAQLKLARVYIKSVAKHTLFTDESQTMLDTPDGWAKGCVLYDTSAHMCLSCHQAVDESRFGLES